jgi:hypothetical protein
VPVAVLAALTAYMLLVTGRLALQGQSYPVAST